MPRTRIERMTFSFPFGPVDSSVQVRRDYDCANAAYSDSDCVMMAFGFPWASPESPCRSDHHLMLLFESSTICKCDHQRGGSICDEDHPLDENIAIGKYCLGSDNQIELKYFELQCLGYAPSPLTSYANVKKQSHTHRLLCC